MSDKINEYREAKNTYFQLRNQAKKELLARFHELAQDLLQLQRELLEDFGEKVPIPTKPKKSRKPKPAATKSSAAAKPSAPSGSPAAKSKLTPAQKQLQLQKKKLADAQAAGKPTKTIEDRIYELEDEIRLAQSK